LLEIAKQIVVPIPGVEYGEGQPRLFAVELQSQELTGIRNAIVKLFTENQEKKFTKTEIQNVLADQKLPKKQADGVLKQIGSLSGKSQW